MVGSIIIRSIVDDLIITEDEQYRCPFISVQYSQTERLMIYEAIPALPNPIEN